MLGHRTPEIVLGAMLMILVFAMGFLAASQFFPQASPVHTEQEATKGIDHQSVPGVPQASKVGEPLPPTSGSTPQHAQEVTVYGIRVGEGVLAIATIFLVAATWALVKSAERTAERQLRAYVLTEGGAIKILQEELTLHGLQALVEFHVRIKNFGQTPAYDFTTWLNINVFDRGYEGPFAAAPHPSERPSKSVLGPDNGTFLNDWKILTPEQYDGVKAERLAIFLWGSVNYRDAFGVNRAVDFRFMNGRATSPAAGEPSRPGWPLFPHKEGNDAD